MASGCNQFLILLNFTKIDVTIVFEISFLGVKGKHHILPS